MTALLPCLLRHALPLVPVRSAGSPPPSHWCYGRSDWPACPASTRAAALRWQHAHSAMGGPPEGLRDGRPLVIRCSTLQRCELLTQEIRGLGINFILKKDDRLAEIDFGRWEGRLWSDLPRQELDAWAADFAHHRLGQTGDSVQSWLTRVIAALQDSGWHPPHNGPTDDVWITHAGVMRAAQWWWQAGCPARVPDTLSADAWPSAAPAYGHWLRVVPGLGPVAAGGD